MDGLKKERGRRCRGKGFRRGVGKGCFEDEGEGIVMV